VQSIKIRHMSVPLRLPHPGCAQTQAFLTKHVLRQAPFRQGLTTARPSKRGVLYNPTFGSSMVMMES